jgi:hypothetical protein
MAEKESNARHQQYSAAWESEHHCEVRASCRVMVTYGNEDLARIESDGLVACLAVQGLRIKRVGHRGMVGSARSNVILK